MAIILEYEDNSEVSPDVIKANVLQEDASTCEDEEENYPPDPDYSTSRSSTDATSSERQYDEVLGYLLREHQQQPLHLLSTVIDYLFRETDIIEQEGVDAQVSEMMLAATKRRCADTEYINNVFGGPDKIPKLEEMFEKLSEIDDDNHKIDVLGLTTPPMNTKPGVEASSPHSNGKPEDLDEAIEGTETLTTTMEDIFEMEQDKHAEIITSPKDVLEEIAIAANLEPTTGKSEEVKATSKCSCNCTADIERMKPNSGNGANLASYSWTQTLFEITIYVPIPVGTRSKAIACIIQPRHIEIGLKNDMPLLEGDIYKPVKPDETLWSIEDNKVLAIHMTKQTISEWWERVLEGEPSIDTSKIVPPHASLSDLHPDTRQHVEQMMFNQQKISTSLVGENGENDILRKFMSEGLELYAD